MTLVYALLRTRIRAGLFNKLLQVRLERVRIRKRFEKGSDGQSILRELGYLFLGTA